MNNQGHVDKEFWTRRLNLWLDEWEVYQKLLAIEDEEFAELDSSKDGTSSSDDLLPDISPYDHTSINSGEIRVLSHHLSGNQDEPVYVAVISEWEDDWLVAPFSPFSEPASTGEMLTGIDICGLRVLSLWNAHTVTQENLSFSWLDGSLEDQVRRDAWNVFRHVSLGEPLSAELALRIGPPINHPEDPRKTYQQEQASKMYFFRELWDVPEMPNIVEFEIPTTESVTSESRQFALAANVITPRESVEIYDVEGAGLLLCVSFIPDDGNLRLFFELLGKDGERAGVEGYEVDYQSLPRARYPLTGCEATIELPNPSVTPRFRLLGPDGTEAHLVRTNT